MIAALLIGLQDPAPAQPVRLPDPAAVSPERLRATLEALCAQPRLAGTPESKAAADYAQQVLEQSGFRVERPQYQAYLPRQTGQSLALVRADGTREELDLLERGYEQDPWSQRGHQPPMHGLTHPGSARGRVVYAGYGSEEDFAALREALGEGLHGTIALVRYGGLFRGLKVENAARAGCAGALLYSDPEDDGVQRGPVLPEERWRPEYAIQRGSVYNGSGDPLTPGYAATADAPRVHAAQAPGLVAIPSLPVSAATAARLFGPAGRPAQPAALDTEAEMSVRQDPGLVPIEDVVGFLPGTTRPDEWVILGGHRDAWGFGATDNGSGSTVLLETARVLGAACAAGWRPDRSLLIALWDAEEWGMVGSTEWVEEQRETLLAHGFAYVNLDSVASGPEFGASCTPGLVEALRAACAAEGLSAPESLGVPGGGSDHVPFLEIAGMEVMGFGFGGGSGTYHSALDTPWVVEHFLDPDFGFHARATRLAVRLAGLLADGGTRLDGVAGWCAQAAQGASGLKLPPELSRELAADLERLQSAPAAGGGRPHPERFLRLLVPAEPGGRNLLWRSSGYGADWFPEVTQCLQRSGDAGDAVARVHRALLAAAMALQNPLQNP